MEGLEKSQNVSVHSLTNKCVLQILDVTYTFHETKVYTVILRSQVVLTFCLLKILINRRQNTNLYLIFIYKYIYKCKCNFITLLGVFKNPAHLLFFYII